MHHSHQDTCVTIGHKTYSVSEVQAVFAAKVLPSLLIKTKVYEKGFQLCISTEYTYKFDGSNRYVRSKNPSCTIKEQKTNLLARL